MVSTLERYSVRPLPPTRLASIDRARLAITQHSPRQNQLLAALPSEDYGRLLPCLELVPLPLGGSMYEANERQSYLYFLTEGVVCRFYRLENGSSAEFGVTGREGVVGIAAFLGGDSTSGNAVVVQAGYAYRLRLRLLRKELERDSPLLNLLLRYTLALVTQAGQIAACNRHHTLEQRLCLWILSLRDRLPSNELTMTQEQIAEMLGVRREGVTQAAGNLQKAGLIHYGRGRITVLDRPTLEARSCECYAALKREYDRLPGSEIVVSDDAMHRQYESSLPDTPLKLSRPRTKSSIVSTSHS